MSGQELRSDDRGPTAVDVLYYKAGGDQTKSACGKDLCDLKKDHY